MANYTSDDMPYSARANLHTYPFWMYVDPEFPTTKAWQFNKGGLVIRLYPLFRTSDANSLPIPSLRVENIPFAKWFKPDGTLYTFDPTVAVPVLKPYPSDGDPESYLIDKPDHSYLPPIKPMDSMRFDTFGKIVNGADIEINNRFIELLRFRSQQWWIGQSVKGIVGFNTGVSFDINELGHPVGPPVHKVDISGEFVGDEKPVTLDIIDQVLTDFISDYQPPISEVLMLDAKQHFASREYRRFVLDAATACEYIKDETFRRLWTSKYSTEFNRDKVLGRWDLTNHLDVKLKNNFGISYKEQHLRHWQRIKDLWDARGNVSHGGLCAYGSPQTVVDRDRAKEMLQAVLHCIPWLKSLKK